VSWGGVPIPDRLGHTSVVTVSDQKTEPAPDRPVRESVPVEAETRATGRLTPALSTPGGAGRCNITDVLAELPTGLDPGIAAAVTALRAAGVETFESCEGGPGHAFPEPTVRFHGERSAGPKAVAAAQEVGLPLLELRRVWTVDDGEMTGPYWDLVLRSKCD
jgi:hypothetical protein